MRRDRRADVDVQVTEPARGPDVHVVFEGGHGLAPGGIAADAVEVEELVHLHPRAELIGSLMEGIVAVAADGRIAGANRAALELLDRDLGDPGTFTHKADAEAKLKARAKVQAQLDAAEAEWLAALEAAEQ